VHDVDGSRGPAKSSVNVNGTQTSHPTPKMDIAAGPNPGWAKMITLAVAGLGVFWLLYAVINHTSTAPRSSKGDLGRISAMRSQEAILLDRFREAMDVGDPTTRAFALLLASKSQGEYHLNQALTIYDSIRKAWRYVSDPRGFDYSQKASTSVQAGLAGDCDDFAVLMASSIEAIGGRARLNIVQGDSVDHAFAEVFCEGDIKKAQQAVNARYDGFLERLFGTTRVKEINYSGDSDAGGIWLNLDWFSRYPGGPYIRYKRRVVFYPRENRYTISNN
jgi:hypothetical protein